MMPPQPFTGQTARHRLERRRRGGASRRIAVAARAAATIPSHATALESPDLFLAIDIGNTRLKWALFDAPQPGGAPREQGVVFLEHIDELADSAWK
ncbi:MAG: hypothetical protein RI988_1046, partial [Pseudomonadota bacterium]